MFAGGTDENPTSLSGAAVIKTTESTFKLIYKSETQSDVRISIFDAKNQLIFSERVRNTNGFARPYNFEELAKGEYTIAIEDASGRKIERISTGAGATANKLVNVTKMSSEESKYLLTVGGKGEEALTLNIYDGSNALIHSESKSIKGDFAQLYNLSKVKGQPTFEVQHQDGTVQTLEY